MSSIAKYCVAYVTSPIGKAESIAKALLTQKLVACVNIVPQVKSMYWWEGQICSDEEALLIIKTKKDLQNQVIECVKKNHEYSVPEVIFMDITDGNEDYLKWIHDSTSCSHTQ
ncbi:hypothetical protein C9374_013463 [Naegleria lovaniensis]|uniref:Divalent-cation tolerance protein CutA n=1 Tax=Naegleria lovaniensis TaxID=51637 RepID=A0AA88GZD8_NAELO|nr:uncharacterized protein C9374_013463 [Naegleria lovaniensis]KAG2391978.1 hypothetical protein C9374_013463 [Naegleria lovaniensis]